MLNLECVKFPARTGAQSGQLACSPPTHEPNGDRAPAAASSATATTRQAPYDPHDHLTNPQEIRQSSIPSAYRTVLKYELRVTK